MTPYGRHLGPGGRNVLDAVSTAVSEGATAIQVFAGGRIGRRVSWPADPSSVAEALADRYLSVHASYVVGVSSGERQEIDRAYLRETARWCRAVGGRSVIVHPGSAPWPSSADAVAERVRLILSEWPDDVELLLENSAGGGEQWAREPAALARVVEAVADDRLGVCLDTTHAWAAGWPASTLTPDRWPEVRLLHFNPPMVGVERGSRRDRHGSSSASEWDESTLVDVVRRWRSVPIITEANPSTADETAWLARALVDV